MKLKSASILAAALSVTAVLFLWSAEQNQSAISLMENKEIEEAFVQYIAKYGKTYATKAEVTRRYENFARSYKMIEKHSKEEGSTFKMALNQFADMDCTERKNAI